MVMLEKSRPGVWISPSDVAVRLSNFYRLCGVDVTEISFKATRDIILSFMKIMVSHILREVNDRDTVSLFDKYGFLVGDEMKSELGGSDDANDLWYDMQYLAKKLTKQYIFRENTYYMPIVVGGESNYVIFLREDFDIWKFHGMRMEKKIRESEELEEAFQKVNESEIELLKEQIKMLRDKIEVLEFDKQKLLFSDKQEVMNANNTNRYPR